MTHLRKYRRVFESTPITLDDTSLSVTLSAGVACSYREIAPDDLIRLADQALYRAKDAGRNRIVCQAPLTNDAQPAYS